MSHFTVLAAMLLLPLLAVARFAGAAERFDAEYGSGERTILVATGSPGELGLLDVLATAFSRQHQVAVRWKKAGSGEALALLKQGKVDVVLVHAPEAERQAVAEGWAAERTLVGANAFILVGPADDPARVAEATDAADAYRRIAKAQSTFLSRGDNSGTQQKEAALWRKAGVKPEGAWYVVTRAFMRAALARADRLRAYFMTDDSTWIAARRETAHLKVLLRGDPALVNVYHALRAARPDSPSSRDAAALVAFLRSAEAQVLVRDFGKQRYGEPLYRDAEAARRFDK